MISGRGVHSQGDISVSQNGMLDVDKDLAPKRPQEISTGCRRPSRRRPLSSREGSPVLGSVWALSWGAGAAPLVVPLQGPDSLVVLTVILEQGLPNQRCIYQVCLVFQTVSDGGAGTGRLLLGLSHDRLSQLKT